MGVSLFWLGEFSRARLHWEQGSSLYDPQQHGALVSSLAGNPVVAGLSYASLVLWYLGYPEQALKQSREAIALAQELAHSYSLSFALFCAAWLHQCRQEGHCSPRANSGSHKPRNRAGVSVLVAMSTTLRGWVLAVQGQGEEGIAQIREGLAAHQATGAELHRPHYLALLAEAYEGVGQIEEGLNALAEALEIVGRTGEREYEAELYRLKGELSLKSRQVKDKSKTTQGKSEVEKEAEECFWKAVEIAQKQQAKSLELRAVMSLARLWQQQGKNAGARRMLAEIYGWFTEGFLTPPICKKRRHC